MTVLQNSIHIQVRTPLALGSPGAQEDVVPILEIFSQAHRPHTLVNLDFHNVTHTNGSYLRASLLWALLCGRAELLGSQSVGNEPWAIRPFPLFPIVSNCARTVAEEIHDFLIQRGESILLTEEGIPPVVESAAILGSLDAFLADTLGRVCLLGEVTAQNLHAQAGEPISINAWSNRLLDLYAKRLVTRRREGKFWIYSPIAKSHHLWA